MEHHHRPAILKMMAMGTLPRLLRNLQAAHLARFFGERGVHTLLIINIQQPVPVLQRPNEYGNPCTFNLQSAQA
jgi:hypothetical protein